MSDKDTMKVCVYQNGNTYETNLLSKINQLLCVNNNIVLAFTNDYVYRLNGNNCTKVMDYPLPIPVTYRGNNIIADSNNTKYICGNDYLQESVPATENSTIETSVKETTLTYHEDIPEFYFADAGITVSKIKKAFADFEISKVTKANGTDIKSGKLGTGAKIYFADNKTTTIIIHGDLTGEGNINSRDIKAILDQLSGKKLLTGEYIIAADITLDGKVTTKDALFIAKIYETPSH